MYSFFKAAFFLLMILLLYSCSSVESLIAFKEIDSQVIKDGYIESFGKGILYRRPGFPLQLVLKGTHYEMGVQRGVLLKKEIRFFAEKLRDLIIFYARLSGVAVDNFYPYIKSTSSKLVSRLPQRFKEELEGMASGSGVPLEALNIFTAFDDLYRTMSCTGILAITPDGKLIHARNEDNGFGQYYQYVIIRYEPDGYNSFISVGNPGWIGVSTAYNLQGVRFSHNTRFHKGINPNGMPQHLIPRIVLEECSTLEEIKEIFNHYSGYIMGSFLWSDLKNNSGFLLEAVPSDSAIYKVIPLKGNNLWHINQYINKELIERYERPFLRFGYFNTVRAKILSDLIDPKQKYSLQDLVGILRTKQGPFSEQYKKEGLFEGICNKYTHNMIIFDPEGRGLYLATGRYYGSCNAVYFYPSDFSADPVKVLEGKPIHPIEEEIGRIEGDILTDLEKYSRYNDLKNKYPEVASLYYLTAVNAFTAGLLKEWAAAIEKAYKLSAGASEIKIEYAAVLFFKKRDAEALKLLESMQIEPDYSSYYRALYLRLLAEIYAKNNNISRSKELLEEFERYVQEKQFIRQIQGYIDKIKQ